MEHTLRGADLFEPTSMNPLYRNRLDCNEKKKKKSHEFHLLCSKTSQILSQRKTKLDLIYADEHFFFFFFKSTWKKSIAEMDRDFPSKSTKSIIKRKSDGIVI